jgi:hypothetical protein
MVARIFLLGSFRCVSTGPGSGSGSGGPCLEAAILVLVSFSASFAGLEASHVGKIGLQTIDAGQIARDQGGGDAHWTLYFVRIEGSAIFRRSKLQQ